MFVEVLGLLSASTVAYFVYYIIQWYANLSKYKLPPGPLCLPFVGSLLGATFTFFQRQHYENAKKFGKVVRTMVGPYHVIQLNDPKIIKEAFSRDVLVPRPHFWSIEQRNIITQGATDKTALELKIFASLRSKTELEKRQFVRYICFLSLCVVFSKGEMWKEHRRFILQTFRDFGVGKFKMEEKIVEEAVDLIKHIESTNGQPLDTKIPLSITVASVIGSVLTGNRYKMDDPVLLQLLQYTKEHFEFTAKKIVLAVLPVTRHIPPIRATYFRFMTVIKGIYHFFTRPIAEHLENYVPDRNSDFLESYISAVKSGQYSTLSTKEIPLVLEDLFEAGYETTTTTLRWVSNEGNFFVRMFFETRDVAGTPKFLMMALHPEIQRRVQTELDQQVPSGGFAKPSEKLDMPYVEATLMEVHRYGSVVPMGVNHCAEEDIQIEGYDIPKGSWVQANIYYVHHNDEWWQEPENFNPDRFLTKDGEVQTSDYLMPFGLGKRRCLGEALAKAELYILFTAVAQRFSINLPEGADPSSVDLTPTSGITADTQPHKLRFVPRS